MKRKSPRDPFQIGGLEPHQWLGIGAGLWVIHYVFPAICRGALEARNIAAKKGDFVKAGRLTEVAAFFAPIPIDHDVARFAERCKSA